MFTERNNIEVSDYMSQADRVEVDTLFEICDAELNSDARVHSQFISFTLNYKEFTKAFGRYLRPMIHAVADRESLMKYGSYPRELVALEISKLWVRRYYEEIRIKKESKRAS